VHCLDLGRQRQQWVLLKPACSVRGERVRGLQQTPVNRSGEQQHSVHSYPHAVGMPDVPDTLSAHHEDASQSRDEVCSAPHSPAAAWPSVTVAVVVLPS
jgi:hypothetical protein